MSLLVVGLSFCCLWNLLHSIILLQPSAVRPTTYCGVALWLAGCLQVLGRPFRWLHCEAPWYFSRESLLRLAEILQRFYKKHRKSFAESLQKVRCATCKCTMRKVSGKRSILAVLAEYNSLSAFWGSFKHWMSCLKPRARGRLSI